MIVVIQLSVRPFYMAPMCSSSGVDDHRVNEVRPMATRHGTKAP